MVETVIHILSAVISSEAEETLALVVGVVVQTGGTILAGVEFLAAEGNLALTVLTCRRRSQKIQTKLSYTTIMIINKYL